MRKQTNQENLGGGCKTLALVALILTLGSWDRAIGSGEGGVLTLMNSVVQMATTDFEDCDLSNTGGNEEKVPITDDLLDHNALEINPGGTGNISSGDDNDWTQDAHLVKDVDGVSGRYLIVGEAFHIRVPVTDILSDSVTLNLTAFYEENLTGGDAGVLTLTDGTTSTSGQNDNSFYDLTPMVSSMVNSPTSWYTPYSIIGTNGDGSQAFYLDILTDGNTVFFKFRNY